MDRKFITQKQIEKLHRRQQIAKVQLRKKAIQLGLCSKEDDLSSTEISRLLHQHWAKNKKRPRVPLFLTKKELYQQIANMENPFSVTALVYRVKRYLGLTR